MHGPVHIVGGARTPMTRHVGMFKDLSAIELGAIASRAAMDRSGVEPAWIDHVVFGNVQQTSSDAIYGARHVGLKAGLPIEVPALTVNRLCGSGLQAAVTGAQHLQLEEAEVVLAGGMENMTQAPHVVRGMRSGLRLGNGELEDSLWSGLLDPVSGCTMADTAENCAAEYGIDRAAQDAYALRSQQLAARAWDEGRLGEEVVPVEVETRKGPVTVARDDHLRPDTTLDTLASLPPAFTKDGTVTAGNASGIVDGGAALVLASEAAVERRALSPLGRLVGWAVTGVEPRLMGLGPVPATRQLLEKAGLSLGDIDLVEVNEAFAGQYLAVEQALALDRDRVNVNGGAIALGHPLGMTGTRLLLTLLLELRRRGLRRGIATACIGGGQGIAALVEAA
ncbi:MAG: acetyl-CoA C-acyltransferase [Vicinamibacterales bacterium]|jgi:acetyl-CoA acetyltransferase family protein|nr:acetyl-CoA C-acyltransferase [Acidobacteriota bacterium]MDP7472090.1 acetyl-CoA C-acyltransferase [Vicinamibacterales bacterium]MDP7671830.1 acetyl-CoA C-acyltransferase [Vicinamibacterales bacterium]HJO38654.1 acetyl-CoA C-acyltransferase [Vicinamibacterales bacterium]|tara:strand:+ start:277 stop:1458 length:1182 start_codon:yes stop_codon:yes gene_type:complete